MPFPNHTVDKALKQRVIERDGRLCAYCGTHTGSKPEIDHYLPISHGGTRDIVNLVVSCGTCNRVKGNRIPHGPWGAQLTESKARMKRERSIARKAERLSSYIMAESYRAKGTEDSYDIWRQQMLLARLIRDVLWDCDGLDLSGMKGMRIEDAIVCARMLKAAVGAMS